MRANYEIIESVTGINSDVPQVLIVTSRELGEGESWSDSFYREEAKRIAAFLASFFCRKTLSEVVTLLRSETQSPITTTTNESE